MMNFTDWIKSEEDFTLFSEAVKFDLARKIRKGIKKSKKKRAAKVAKGTALSTPRRDYRPGTFGLEIEFRAEEDDDREIDYDELEMLLRNDYDVESAFEQQAEPPEDPDNWEEWNPPPEDPEDWEYDNPSPDVKSWESDNPEPEEDDFEDEDEYEEAKEEWQEKKEEIEEEYSTWESEKEEIEEEYEDWKKQYDEIKDEWDEWENWGRDNAFDEFISDLMYHDTYNIERFGIDIPYLGGDLQGSIDKYIYEINRIKGQRAHEGDASSDSWGVGEDESGVVEIRSPICSQKHFPAVIELLEGELSNEEFDGGTSAHVHIGMPKYADLFDLLAMANLADEEAIEQWAGEDRAFQTWAKFNSQLQANLHEELPVGEFDVNDKEVRNAISKVGRYFGTNLTAFFRHTTVEFRYLSSQLVENPHKLIEFIQYYQTLPKIAETRKRVVFTTNKGNLVITRLPGGKMRIEKGQHQTKMPEESPWDLRQQAKTSPATLNVIKKYVLKQIGNINVEEFNELIRPKLDYRDWSIYIHEIYKIFGYGQQDEYKNQTMNNVWEKLTPNTQEMLIKTIIKEYQKPTERGKFASIKIPRELPEKQA